MLFLVIALQMATTNCIPDFNGGMNCTTMSLPPLPNSTLPATRSRGGRYDLFDISGKRKHRKAVGNLIAKGDCGGAYQYALGKGDLELAEMARTLCRR